MAEGGSSSASAAWEEAHVSVDAAKPGRLVCHGREAMELIEEAQGGGGVMMILREQCRGRGSQGSQDIARGGRRR